MHAQARVLAEQLGHLRIPHRVQTTDKTMKIVNISSKTKKGVKKRYWKYSEQTLSEWNRPYWSRAVKNKQRSWEIRGQGAVGHEQPCLATCTYYCRTLQGMLCRCVLWLCNFSSISGDKTQGAPHSLNRGLRYVREEQLNFPSTQMTKQHLPRQNRCGQRRWMTEIRERPTNGAQLSSMAVWCEKCPVHVC